MGIVVDQPDYLYMRVILFQPFAPFFAAGEKQQRLCGQWELVRVKSGVILITVVTAIKNLRQIQPDDGSPNR